MMSRTAAASDSASRSRTREAHTQMTSAVRRSLPGAMSARSPERSCVVGGPKREDHGRGLSRRKVIISERGTRLDGGQEC